MRYCNCSTWCFVSNIYLFKFSLKIIFNFYTLQSSYTLLQCNIKKKILCTNITEKKTLYLKSKQALPLISSIRNSLALSSHICIQIQFPSRSFFPSSLPNRTPYSLRWAFLLLLLLSLSLPLSTTARNSSHGAEITFEWFSRQPRPREVESKRD